METIRRSGREGSLSSREVEERIEQVFRARTMSELDAVVAGVPLSPHVAADMVLTHGIPLPPTGPARPWWHGIVLWTAIANSAWIVIWLIWGGSVGWLILGMASSMAAFLFRLVRRHRKHVMGAPVRRSRRS
jgi:hypothetical protein